MLYLVDLQSVHGFRCYDNIARTRNVSECSYSLYAWLKNSTEMKLQLKRVRVTIQKVANQICVIVPSIETTVVGNNEHYK